MDSPDVVEMGLTQMLSLVLNHNSAAKLDVIFFLSKFCCFRDNLNFDVSPWIQTHSKQLNAGSSNWWFRG